MSPLLRIAPLLLVAGCSWFGGSRDEPRAETRPEYLACQRAAREDPEVKSLTIQINPLNSLSYDRVQPRLERAQARAYRDCLRRQGLAMPGGVEPVVRR